MGIQQFYEMYGKHNFESIGDLFKAMHSFEPQICIVGPDDCEFGGAVFFIDGDAGLLVFTTNDQEGRDEDAFGVHLVECEYCAVNAQVLGEMSSIIWTLKSVVLAMDAEVTA